MVRKWWPKFGDHVSVSCWTLSIWWFFQADLYSNISRLWENRGDFLNGVFCILLPGGFVEMLHNSRFSYIHSSKNERQLSNCMEASSFVKFQRWLALRCLMTIPERWGIFEWGFWQLVIRNIVEMTFDPKFTDLHSYPKERLLQKSCVSFGEECR